MTNKTINELCETFIYLCDQHGVLIQATSIYDTSFSFKPNIVSSNLASVGLSDADLMKKCAELAKSVGLICNGNKCQIDKSIKLQRPVDEEE
jgi:hypothetical protein